MSQIFKYNLSSHLRTLVFYIPPTDEEKLNLVWIEKQRLSATGSKWLQNISWDSQHISLCPNAFGVGLQVQNFSPNILTGTMLLPTNHTWYLSTDPHLTLPETNYLPSFPFKCQWKDFLKNLFFSITAMYNSFSHASPKLGCFKVWGFLLEM